MYSYHNLTTGKEHLQVQVQQSGYTRKSLWCYYNQEAKGWKPWITEWSGISTENCHRWGQGWMWSYCPLWRSGLLWCYWALQITSRINWLSTHTTGYHNPYKGSFRLPRHRKREILPNANVWRYKSSTSWCIAQILRWHLSISPWNNMQHMDKENIWFVVFQDGNKQ